MVLRTELCHLHYYQGIFDDSSCFTQLKVPGFSKSTVKKFAQASGMLIWMFEVLPAEKNLAQSLVASAFHGLGPSWVSLLCSQQSITQLDIVALWFWLRLLKVVSYHTLKHFIFCRRCLVWHLRCRCLLIHIFPSLQVMVWLCSCPSCSDGISSSSRISASSAPINWSRGISSSSSEPNM